MCVCLIYFVSQPFLSISDDFFSLSVFSTCRSWFATFPLRPPKNKFHSGAQHILFIWHGFNWIRKRECNAWQKWKFHKTNYGSVGSFCLCHASHGLGQFLLFSIIWLSNSISPKIFYFQNTIEMATIICQIQIH